MLKLVLALAATLFLSPALAKNTTIANKAAPKAECVSPDALLAKVKLQPFADLSGDALKRFNDRYTALFHDAAPNVDRVIAFGAKDLPIVILFGVRGACVVGTAQVKREVVEKLLSDDKIDDGSF